MRLFRSTLRTTVFTRRAYFEFAFAILTIAILGAASALRAAPAFSCAFDGPETTWNVLDNGVRSEVVKQELSAGGARDSSGLERVVVAATAGDSVLLECAVPPIAALDEMQVRLWVKAARPDVCIAARVRLPRSVDPQTKAARSLILKAGAYHRPGQWQELVLSDVPKLLAAQVRLLRATPGSSIDSREAYIDAVVLVVPGDPKGFEVETDQLEVEGVIITPAERSKELVLARSSSPVVKAGFEDDRPAIGDRTSPVRLLGTMLTVDGKPFLPRVIQWNGEPLKFLAERGFNVVQVAEAAGGAADCGRRTARIVVSLQAAAARRAGERRFGCGRRSDTGLAFGGRCARRGSELCPALGGTSSSARQDLRTADLDRAGGKLGRSE